MSFTDNPIVQKIAVGITIASLTAIGGGLIATRDTVLKHSEQIEVLQDAKQDVKDIKDAISAIKTDVARLEERTRPKE